ncbi:MAG: hypothetical protein HUU60_04210 [Armatimonadetes bacterium]|nr:hypothetical protein [Armatimonadota bacterium]
MKGLFASLAALACVGTFAQAVIIMPDSTNNRTVLFNPQDGSVINGAYFALAAGTPIHAMRVGDEIWVSEQIGDRVSRWSLTGTFLGQIGTAGFDNIRGMGRVGDTIYVTNAGTANGAPGNAVVMLDPSGAPLGSFSTVGLAPGPFGVLEHQSGILVSSSSANDDIHKFSLTGTPLGTFHNTTSLNFAEQMAYAADGNVLVGGFSSNNVVRLDVNSGALIDSFAASGARGVIQLCNGNIMWTNGSGAHIRDVVAGSSALIYAGGGRYLQLIRLNGPGDVNGDGCVDDTDLAIGLESFGMGCEGVQADLNLDGVVDDTDLALVLENFGVGC